LDEEVREELITTGQQGPGRQAKGRGDSAFFYVHVESEQNVFALRDSQPFQIAQP
jgi:hypothetical protein